ncbi:protocadherin-10-like isoform X5 [Chiloscyllium plagiosum]|uniref:protocadherin-10-like isoform X5 n=1 Tax=Chiloscyllium plagiosum TaxID=36176 RepID=UPI001CB8038A|nr:protocadherin-10-like isoform X5 [Chiloscyllium plagiosum]
MAFLRKYRVSRWACIYLIHVHLTSSVFGNIRYSIPEELELGAFVGNIAEDLGLDVKQMSERRFRIASENKGQYLTVNFKTGILHVKEKIDREQLCEQSLSCILMLQAVIENPLKIYRIEVTILDTNDNTPVFQRQEVNLEISEMTALGTAFPLQSAVDPDAGTNSVHSYQLSPNQYFTLKSQLDGRQNGIPELVLQRHLDREAEPNFGLRLTAFDGGNPKKFGTMQIKINVVDANDNPPVCQQDIYQITISENIPKDTLIVKVTAMDMDQGLNGEVIYSFSDHTPVKTREVFSLDSITGEIRVAGALDFEESDRYQISVQAKDKGSHPLEVHCNVLVTITDINDNSPEIILITTTKTIAENVSQDTVIAVLKIVDRDSKNAADVSCRISRTIPFKLITSFDNYYTLVTHGDIDREVVPEYNITITCTDNGSPPLSATETIQLQVSDINDNAPRFTQPSVIMHVAENNVIGASIGSVTAFDPDSNQNAELSFSILHNLIHNLPVSTLVSINTVNGVIFAEQSFDFEQITSFEVRVKVTDAGAPPLSSTVTVNVIVVDQNDNAPVIVSPLPVKGNAIEETIPRSADPGYLVTKVTATDADSGMNAKLSYKIHQSSDESLFTVAQETGELWTIRHFTRKDSIHKKVVILVMDYGTPSLSSTVNIDVYVQDKIENASNTGMLGTIGQWKTDFKFYLMILFGATSFVLLLAIAFLGFKVCSDRYETNKVFCCWNASCFFQRNSLQGIEKASVNLQIAPKSTQAYESENLPRQFRYDPVMNDLLFLKLHDSAASMIDHKIGTCIAAKHEKTLISTNKETNYEAYSSRPRDLEQSSIERCSSGQYGMGLYTSDKCEVEPDPRRLVEIHSRAL